MKLPSIQQVIQDSVRTFKRFPVVLINALIGTIAAVILIDHEGPPQATILFKIVFSTILGIPFLTALVLLAEKRKWGRAVSLVLQLLGVLLIAAYGCAVPANLDQAPAIFLLRQLILAFGLHLCVAFAPYLGAGELNGFWHYNKTLFLRLFTSFIFAVVLYAGLSIALAALDNLFGIDVPIKRYGELWCIIVGLFITWFFLAGIPEDLDALETSTDYPKVIKVFAQYILFPLVLVYLVILYAYLIKIIVEWNWPQGWVSKLILGFAATGIFTLLLLYPVREQQGNSWIRKASRWFYFIMIPLVLMLFPAVWRRISEYGVTEGRYLAIALGLWLAGIIIYYIFSKSKSIKVIPTSLGVLALISSFGPWGVFAVSEKSQVDRLQGILLKDSILIDGKIRPAPGVVSAEDTRQISSIISYLHDFHGYDRIQPWFTESLKADSGGSKWGYKEPAFVAKKMGVEYLTIWFNQPEDFIRLSADWQKVMDVHGYDCLLCCQYIDNSHLFKAVDDQDLSYRVDSSHYIITFMIASEGVIADSLLIDLHPVVKRLLEKYQDSNVSNIPPENMALSDTSRSMKIKVYLRSIHLGKEEKELKLIDYNADIFYSSDKKIVP
jgi:hypothetical protein